MILRYPDIPLTLPPHLFRYPVTSLRRKLFARPRTVRWEALSNPGFSPQGSAWSRPRSVRVVAPYFTEAKTHNRGIRLMLGWPENLTVPLCRAPRRMFDGVP
jgi:hypothetical protein